jgi:hypothetical protein
MPSLNRFELSLSSSRRQSWRIWWSDPPRTSLKPVDSMAMICDPVDIAEVFGIFHDGQITHFEQRDGALLLGVNIRYLAERVAPTYRGFLVKLHGVRGVSFEPWPNDAGCSLAIITECKAIFEPVLDILDGQVVAGSIQITCNQADPKYPYCGGELKFCSAGVEVFDESSASHSLEDLRDLAAAYWEAWSNAHRI